MIYATVIYLLFVILFAPKNYLKKQDISLLLKTLYLIFLYVFFIYYFIDFRVDLWGLLRNGVEVFYTSDNHDMYSKFFDISTSILYFVCCITISIIIIDLAMRAKNIKRLIYCSPPVAIITSIDLYKMIISNYGFKQDGLQPFLIIFLIVGILYAGLILFFMKTPIKRLFYST